MPRPRTVNTDAYRVKAKLSINTDGTVVLLDTDDQHVPRGVIGSITETGAGWHATIRGIRARGCDTQRQAVQDLFARHLARHRKPSGK